MKCEFYAMVPAASGEGYERKALQESDLSRVPEKGETVSIDEVDYTVAGITTIAIEDRCLIRLVQQK